MTIKHRRALDITSAEFYCRDETDTGRRLMVEHEDDELGAVITVLESGREYMRVRLDLCDVETLAEKLASVAEHGWREICEWCDVDGMINGPRGPIPCDHNMLDAATRERRTTGTV